MNSRALPPLALLLAAGIFFAYVKPTWSGPVAATKAAIAIDDAALEAADKYMAQQKTLIDAKANIDPENLARLSTFLPNSVDNVGIILDLNALAVRSQLSLTSINVASSNTNKSSGSTPIANPAGGTNTAGPATAGGQGGALPVSSRPDPIGSVDLSLSVAGTYTAFQNFLASIEKSARLLDVRDLTVKGSDTGVYTYQMTLRLYWLR